METGTLAGAAQVTAPALKILRQRFRGAFPVEPREWTRRPNKTPCRHKEPAGFPFGIPAFRPGVLTVSGHLADARISFVGIRLNAMVAFRACMCLIFVDIAPFLVANVAFPALTCLFPHQVMWTPRAFFG